MLGEVDRDRVLTNLRRLTGDVPICDENGCHTIDNRQIESEGLRWAKDYVGKELSQLGYPVELSDWSSSGYADQNIIVRKAGTLFPNEEIYFVAHLDGKKKDLGSRYPAADDNASGVVDLLELARVLSNHTFNRTVVLLFSTGEEQSERGVKSYIGRLSSEELSSIKYVVNVDMVGYDGNRDGVMQLWHGGYASSIALAQIMSDTIKEDQLDLVPELAVGCG